MKEIRKTNLMFVALLCIILVFVIAQKIIINRATPTIESGPVPSAFESAKDYGILDDGTFFVSKEMVPGMCRLKVVIISDEGSEAYNDFLKSFEHMIGHTLPELKIKMLDMGDFFLASPPEKFINPSFYFESGEGLSFPNYNRDKFQDHHLKKSGHGLYVLNLNQE